MYFIFRIQHRFLFRKHYHYPLNCVYKIIFLYACYKCLITPVISAINKFHVSKICCVRLHVKADIASGGSAALRWSVLIKRVIYALMDVKISCALYKWHIFHFNLSFHLWKILIYLSLRTLHCFFFFFFLSCFSFLILSLNCFQNVFNFKVAAYTEMLCYIFLVSLSVPLLLFLFF